MNDLSLLQKIAIWLLPVVFAITLHEVAHGWVAKLLGDRTAESQGRLTLNPLHHIDPVGTVLLPGLLLVFSGFVFGWAKPVPVNWGRLHNPKRDIGLVAIAGPAANLTMIVLWIIVARLASLIGVGSVALPLIFMSAAGIFINSMLMLLNLLPLPPLDGGRVMSCLLPTHLSYKFDKLEPYGMIILVVLMVTPLLSMILGGPLHLAIGLSMDLAGIHPGVLGLLLSPSH
ncbi:MAG: site-2 protease family protein [Candidatus Methylumidiphilus sp.]